MNKSLALFALAAIAEAHAGHGGAYGHTHAPQSYGQQSYAPQQSYGQQSYGRQSYAAPSYGSQSYGNNNSGRSFATLFGGLSTAKPYDAYSNFSARGSYGNNGGYGGYGYDSDGPRRSVHDKDGETYGHENSPHAYTEFGEKDNHGGDR